MKPIAILYEHPDWFRPLFAELDRRGLPWVGLDAANLAWDPGDTDVPYSLVVNRASPSAYLREHAGSLFATLHWLGHLERLGIPVLNGSRPYRLELSKATQLDLLDDLDLPYPAARVINHLAGAVEAARGLRYPVLVKANVGGSGAGIVRFDTEEQLRDAVYAGRVDCGRDGTALVQELAPLRGGYITRVEVLDDAILYGIRVYPAGDSFNLCPADVCQTTDGQALERGACALDAQENGLRVEAAEVPEEVAEEVLAIARAADLDVGGIEYLIDDRDGSRAYYDINALSNFVADPVRVVGFDPFARLVDVLEARAQQVADPAGVA